MKKQTALASCSLFLITLLGCSATSIHRTENINWQKVRFATVKTTQPDQWHFGELIRQELTSLGITSPENPAQPDLLITYTPEVREDLTQESQRVQRLRRLHLDFYPSRSNAPINQVDYVFPQGEDKPDPAFAIREIFATLTTCSEPISTDDSPTLPATTEKPKASLQATVNTDSTAEAVEFPPAQKDTRKTLQTNKKGPAQPTTPKTPSSWLPRFRSWGLEAWGGETRE